MPRNLLAGTLPQQRTMTLWGACRRFTAPPALDPATSKWSYPAWKVENADNKNGAGVFATRDVQAGELVPYGGVVIQQDEFCKRLSHKRAGTHWVVPLDDGALADGNPAREPPDAKGAWLGARANEAAPGEKNNAMLHCVRVADLPEIAGLYPGLDLSSGSVLVLETMGFIGMDKELLWYYGSKYGHRGYPVSQEKCDDWGVLDPVERSAAASERRAAAAERRQREKDKEAAAARRERASETARAALAEKRAKAAALRAKRAERARALHARV